jgi:AcrR family transcriptional regulator
MVPDVWVQLQSHVLQLEREGLVTRTFRRLDPERQEAILNAILDEAAEVGPASINIKRVAERADVSVGALYTYFPDRDAMLSFIIALTVRITVDGLNQARPQWVSLPLREALLAYLRDGVLGGPLQAGLTRLYVRGAYQGDPDLLERLVQPIAELRRAVVRDMVMTAAGRGELRPHVDIEGVAQVLYTLTSAIGDGQLLPYLSAYFQVTEEEMPVERLVAAMLDLVERGVAPAVEAKQDARTQVRPAKKSAWQRRLIGI